MATSELETLRATFAVAQQGHVFDFVDRLDPLQLNSFVTDLKSVDLSRVKSSYDNAVAYARGGHLNISPYPDVTPLEGTEEERKCWESLGIKKIAEGKVGILLLAGGQGTRLGTTEPKGMYDVELPSHKSLYQLQGERIARLQQIVREREGIADAVIPWYIMTSDMTEAETIKFFESHSFFGLERGQVFFFQQADLPCVTPDGKLILETPSKLARAPNGNGGMYEALDKSGALADMQRRGVEFVCQYCVDNSLIVMADPVFVGCCASRGADVGVKVVAKAYPAEPVGSLCVCNGRPGVVEYSEIPPEVAQAVDPKTNTLVYNASHICINLFTVEFLLRIAREFTHQLPFHVAKKKIPSVNDKGETVTPADINGWKLEMFIFDSFEFANKLVGLEVRRQEEFAPLKNGPSSKLDCPASCRASLSELHKTWVRRAGGTIADSGEADIVEVSPTVSYRGENLGPLVAGKTFYKFPVHIQ
eukprot:TRINITY_DN6597_c0_g1_i1.p1 TRINITY_DN6597_c0_g1~~TRINITY_DN6597_c0_g1_i1.p1  ORF type:complete len:476 (+),score=145.81 TRINITY_DN6597_c0_g1_i1:85-1512(+)